MHIVKGEAQKSPLFWRFSGGFWFSQERLFSRNSTRKPLNLIKSPILTNTPCKSPFLYNAPSVHTVNFKVRNGPKAQWTCPKTSFKMSPKNFKAVLDTFNDFLGDFSGGSKKIFLTLMCTFRLSEFRDSVGEPAIAIQDHLRSQMFAPKARQTCSAINLWHNFETSRVQSDWRSSCPPPPALIFLSLPFLEFLAFFICKDFLVFVWEENEEGKSAINLSNLGNFCQIWPRAIYLC